MKPLIATFLAASFLALPGTALACSCAPRSDIPQAIEKAARVFLGTVTSIEDIPPFHQRVTFQVSEHYKGDAIDTLQVISAASAAACGYPFQQGIAYVVYARGEGERLTTGTCSRTMAAAPGSDLDVLRRGN